MKLPPIPLVVLDTETTGFVPRVHKVIEFASSEVRNGQMKEEYEQLFTHADVPPVVQVLTRIRTPDLAGKPTFAEKLQEVLAHLPEDALLVGQNIPFDIGMLKGEGIDLTGRPYIDTSMLASLVFPELESYSLGYMSTVLKLNHNPPHRALGDVRATLELLGKCWERLLEMPDDLRDLADAVMARAPKGYQMLFDALPPATAKKEPKWLHEWSDGQMGKPGLPIRPSAHPTLSTPIKSPALMDEPLDPLHLQTVIEGALKDSSTRHWIAVKGLRPILKRLPATLMKSIRVLYPPHSLIDTDAVLRFSKQETYTADEATLALKLAWYEPARRDEFPLHGGEDAVWHGKLSCTATSKAYLDQFNDLPQVVLLDHRELLEFLQEPEHPGAKAMSSVAHIVIDDASMLEDTATKAFGWYCAIDDLRAGAQGHPLLGKFVDTLQLWVEKTRQMQDIRYITNPDLTSQDSKGLRSLLEEVLAKEDWPAQVLRHLDDLQKILLPENVNHRIAWIEQKPNGNQMLQSVPERIGRLLHDNLFSKFPTTLLIPQGSSAFLPEILPPGFQPPKPQTLTLPAGRSSQRSEGWSPNPEPTPRITFDAKPSLDELLTSPPEGKTVILLPGKSAIEDLYVKYTEALEKKGVTMICQGTSGGMGRMQAEFLAAPAPALWLLTPWMFEGVDLPAGTVNHMMLKTLPFDHPNHAVLSRRSLHYNDPFSQYSLPRLLHRLFRLLRTYARIRTTDGDVRLMDDRIGTKSYGKIVKGYLGQFGEEAKDDKEDKDDKEIPVKKAVPTESKPAKKVSKKKAGDQPSLF